MYIYRETLLKIKIVCFKSIQYMKYLSCNFNYSECDPLRAF